MRPVMASVTALVLAAGRGQRMGGADKGWLLLQGEALVLHALRRLQQQRGLGSGQTLRCAISANRNLERYAALGVPVWSDAAAGVDGFQGPLAGFLTGLQHCGSDYLLVVPCDVPRFPLDLLQRLAAALEREQASLALAASRDGDGALRYQPVFCLLQRSLHASLAGYLGAGGRAVQAWCLQQRAALACFDQAGDDAHAFDNLNTPGQWQEWQTRLAAGSANAGRPETA